MTVKRFHQYCIREGELVTYAQGLRDTGLVVNRDR